MNAFCIPPRHVKAAVAAVGPLVHSAAENGEQIVSAKTAEYLSKAVRSVKGLEPRAIDPARWSNATSRLHAFWAAVVSDPLPDDVAHEAHLMLYANPQLELEFMGRGDIRSERHLPAAREFLVGLDRAGGKRIYLFRKLEKASPDGDERFARVRRMMDWQTWVTDAKARVVVSLGGGGFRLFAAIPALKAIDRLVGDRHKISEVWGSSGGAFLGYLYAAGFPLETVDQFAYDLYNGRAAHLVDGSIGSIAKSRIRDAVKGAFGTDVPHAMVDWLTELERREPDSSRSVRRPYYAIASSTERSGLLALTDTSHFSAACADFMVPCDPRLAVAASTAVPFVLRPITGLTDREGEQWYDGSITDENPLALPYVKWMRERHADPAGTPEKLKIVLVNLNMRAAESELLRTVGNLPLLRSIDMVERGSSVIDRLLDSKTLTNIQILTANPDVEVLSLKLSLGWLGAQDPRQIAKAMRTGRTLESWQIVLHTGHATAS